ncbi:MAG: hypothetical protein KDD51_13285, partial [Bdellovibrionales bacterium]|nr:hypothetical protein [Bdellovibrionales bacterium]
NRREKVVGRVSGLGTPPDTVALKRLAPQGLPPGDYSYEVAVDTRGQVLRGTPGKFEVSEGSEGGARSFYPLDFHLSAVAGFQGGRQSFSSQFSWNPTWMFVPTFGVRANLGISAFNKASGGLFVTGTYQLLVAFRFGSSPVFVEAGGGASSWFNFGGTRVCATGNIGLAELSEDFKLFERIFAGYTYLFAARPVHLVNFGLGIRI